MDLTERQKDMLIALYMQYGDGDVLRGKSAFIEMATNGNENYMKHGKCYSHGARGQDTVSVR